MLKSTLKGTLTGLGLTRKIFPLNEIKGRKVKKAARNPPAAQGRPLGKCCINGPTRAFLLQAIER